MYFGSCIFAPALGIFHPLSPWPVGPYCGAAANPADRVGFRVRNRFGTHGERFMPMAGRI